MKEPLLQVSDLTVHFDTEEGTVEAVDEVNLDIQPGEITGVVGESGSGKSVTALAVLRLIRPPGRIVPGEIRFEGRNLLDLSEEEMRSLRGSHISMIFQSPRTSLNPVLSVGWQIERLLRLHKKEDSKTARDHAIQMLQAVRIPAPERIYHEFPHQLSGGMCQRVMIAMALVTNPRLLIADEPTTGLDVSIAAQILDLLREMGDRTGTTILLITHDLGVVAGYCDRVAVMHAGQVVETADVKDLFQRPLHPYTAKLMHSIPRVDFDTVMESIPGSVPGLIHPPPGCRFADRCLLVDEKCRKRKPQLMTVDGGHRVACYSVEGN
jgi:oligopeptide/dipeptide ABC transporter ATP-binding protein